MSCLSRVGIIEALLPGLIALTSILVVIIAFLFEQYVRKEPELSFIKKPYSNLIKLMVSALIMAGITSILSLLYIVKFTNDFLYCFILVLFVVTVIMIFLGTSITAIIILKEGK